VSQAAAPKAAEPVNSVKSMQYVQQAKKAIAEAADRESAKKHLDTVKLRVKERAVPREVYVECEKEFARVWKQEA
jgi:hypothetical protein